MVRRAAVGSDRGMVRRAVTGSDRGTVEPARAALPIAGRHRRRI